MQLAHQFQRLKDSDTLSLSRIVKRTFSSPTEQQERERLDKMYQGLFELCGMCDTPITDASSTIDELLYGEQGLWRGDID